MPGPVDEVEVVERYIILLLGAGEGPIPKRVHVQKELFALVEANPRMGEFIRFERHYFGPYSTEIEDASENPVHHPDAYRMVQGEGLSLTDEGRRVFEALTRENSSNPRFKELLAMMAMVRQLYDGLTRDELLLLIYSTYDEYTDRSQVSEELLEPSRRRRLAESLLRKGAITEGRYAELVS
jgi:hypothetical protein